MEAVSNAALKVIVQLGRHVTADGVTLFRVIAEHGVTVLQAITAVPTVAFRHA